MLHALTFAAFSCRFFIILAHFFPQQWFSSGKMRFVQFPKSSKFRPFLTSSVSKNLSLSWESFQFCEGFGECCRFQSWRLISLMPMIWEAMPCSKQPGRTWLYMYAAYKLWLLQRYIIHIHTWFFPDRFANLYPNLGYCLGYCSCCQSHLMLFAIKSGPYLWAMLLPSITISMWEITSIQPCCTGRYFIQIAGDFELCGSFVSCPWNTLCLPTSVVYPVLLWMFARMLSSFGANTRFNDV